MQIGFKQNRFNIKIIGFAFIKTLNYRKLFIGIKINDIICFC